MEVRALTLSVIGLLLAACGREPRGNSSPSTPLGDSGRNRLVVTTTDFTTGKLAIVDLAGAVDRREIPIHADAVVRAPVGSRYAYVVNRLGGDNVQVVEKSTGKIARQFSVGTGTNPQDIVVLGDELAYVSRLASPQMLKLNPRTGETLALLSGFDGDSDGRPELAWSLRLGNQLLVEEQRLDSATFRPNDHSSLAVIDLGNDSVRNLRLARPNPVSELRLWNGKIYIGEEGVMGIPDGGIERRDAATLQSEGIVAEESELGGDIVDIEILSDTVGVAIVGTTRTTLVSFNPQTGKKGRTLLESAGYTLYRVLSDTTRGVFYVADGDVHRPGIRVFDATTLVERTGNRIAMPLPPYHMELTD